MFEAYRQRSAELGFPEPPPERFAYLGFVFVGATEAEGLAGAEQLMWYLRNNKVAPQFLNPPGYSPPEARVPMLAAAARGEPMGSPIADIIDLPVEALIERGMIFAGDPAQVTEQIVAFDTAVGGLGNLLMMMHAGPMTFEESAASIKLYASEVQPALRRRLATH